MTGAEQKLRRPLIPEYKLRLVLPGRDRRLTMRKPRSGGIESLHSKSAEKLHRQVEINGLRSSRSGSLVGKEESNVNDSY